MITTAIIAEFNPFHKGHEYIIKQAREITGADCILIIMSGDFTQRGSIAIAPKRVRTSMALECGADVVFELPFAYATASAEDFALGAVSLINSLGNVNYLFFGSESGDIDELYDAASILANETPEFKQILSDAQAEGLSYPAAREKAFIAAGGKNDIFTSNNILAIEYIKALIWLKSDIVPKTICRVGQNYNDENYPDFCGESEFISATAFRKYICNYNASCVPNMHRIDEQLHNPDEIYSFMKNTLPASCADILYKEYGKTFPVSDDNMMTFIRYSFLTNKDFLADFADISPNMAKRLKNLYEKEGNLFFMCGYDDFVDKIKTKDITSTRVRRGLLHMMTGFTSINSKLAHENALYEIFPYARILGFNKIGTLFLKEHRECECQILNKLGNVKESLNEYGCMLMDFDLLSASLYASVLFDTKGTVVKDEYRQDMVRIL